MYARILEKFLNAANVVSEEPTLFLEDNNELVFRAMDIAHVIYAELRLRTSSSDINLRNPIYMRSEELIKTLKTLKDKKIRLEQVNDDEIAIITDDEETYVFKSGESRVSKPVVLENFDAEAVVFADELVKWIDIASRVGAYAQIRVQENGVIFEVRNDDGYLIQKIYASDIKNTASSHFSTTYLKKVAKILTFGGVDQVKIRLSNNGPTEFSGMGDFSVLIYLAPILVK